MLSIDTSLIVVFLIVWALVLALSRLFFHPLKKIMKERESKIQRNKDVHKESMEIYDQTLLEIEEGLNSARAVAQKTKEGIERKALKERESILEEINAESRSQIDEAKKQLERQIKSLKKELEIKSKNLAENIERKFLN